MLSILSPSRLDQFAKINLFGPLSIQPFRWSHVPIHRTTGQGNLFITTRDLATVGQLMLNNGTVNGQHILGREWIATSLSSLVAISDSDPYADFYAYMWYTEGRICGL